MPNYHLFDVDGVLTNEVAEPQMDVLEAVTQLQRRNECVSLVTGRSRQWLQDHLFPRVQEAGLLSLWQHIVCAAECGAVHGVGCDTAKWEVDARFSVSNSVIAKLKAAQQSLSATEWDHTKECMASVEAIHGHESDTAHLDTTRRELGLYEDRVRDHIANTDLHLVVSTYAVDVLPQGLSKRIGASYVLSEFARRVAEPHHIFVYGDSKTDLLMAEEAQATRLAGVTFVWLGRGAAPSAGGIETVTPSAPYAPGTVEFLKQKFLV